MSFQPSAISFWLMALGTVALFGLGKTRNWIRHAIEQYEIDHRKGLTRSHGPVGAVREPSNGVPPYIGTLITFNPSRTMIAVAKELNVAWAMKQGSRLPVRRKR